MVPNLRAVLALAVILFSPRGSSAQQTTHVSLSEPGRYELAALFKAADIVAEVEVMSGDTENYDRAVYKARVSRGFKGAEQGETIYFGPFIGERLGWDYIVFLRNVSKPVAPETTANASYGTIRYAEVFNQGYTSMIVSYECVFDGKETAQQCDYGVRVCTDYIILPKSLRAFPPEENDPPFGCRWVRKPVFIRVLEKLAIGRKD